MTPNPSPRSGPPLQGRIRSVVCTRCGCACDDLDLTLAGGRIVEARNACAQAEAWFLEALSEDAPIARVGGQEARAEDAAAAAAEVLAGARRPLVWGLLHLSTEAVGVAVAIADRLRGAIDPAAGPNHPAAVTAFAEWGEVNATLGEVAAQKSLVVLWRADPERTHPRLLERWGFRGADDTRLLRFGTGEPDGAGWEVPPERSLEFLWILRELARERAGSGAAPRPARAGKQPEAPPSGEPLRDQATRLLDRLAAEPHVVLAFEAAAMDAAQQHALRALAATLNGVTRFRLFPLRSAGNRVGAEAVLNWQTGFPIAVDFSAGWPRANGGEHSAARLLERGEVDAALVICASPRDVAAEPALGRLAELPRVVLDSAANPLEDRARVVLRSAPFGKASGGTFFRMDGVALGVRPAVASRYPTEREWLERVLHHLPGRAAATGAGTRGSSSPPSGTSPTRSATGPAARRSSDGEAPAPARHGSPP